MNTDMLNIDVNAAPPDRSAIARARERHRLNEELGWKALGRFLTLLCGGAIAFAVALMIAWPHHRIALALECVFAPALSTAAIYAIIRAFFIANEFSCKFVLSARSFSFYNHFSAVTLSMLVTAVVDAVFLSFWIRPTGWLGWVFLASTLVMAVALISADGGVVRRACLGSFMNWAYEEMDPARDAAMLVEYAELCDRDETLYAYQVRIAEQGRSPMRGEYLAFRDWINDPDGFHLARKARDEASRLAAMGKDASPDTFRHPV